jgi:hypothetical protein
MSCSASDEGLRADPELWLWVWQRNEDLSFIDPAETKLALWVATIALDESGISVDPRRNSVVHPLGTELLAVVRLEARPGFDMSITERVAAEIGGLVEPLGADEVQLDFDALVSQRGFYAELIDAVRARLPQHRLSITALASWCFGDRWLETLAIDAAVPMYYRMGPDGNQIRHYLSSQSQIPATICRDNAGYSLDEPEAPIVGTQRLFVFSAEGWSEELLDATKQKLAAAIAD